MPVMCYTTVIRTENPHCPGGIMGGNKQVYKEAFERARDGKSWTLVERILFRFRDQYTQRSREDGERDGRLAREQSQGHAAPASEAVH